MRTGLTISTAGHAALLLWALVSFSAKPFEAAPAESMPVDIISDKDFSELRAGAKNAPQAEAPKPLVEKVGENKPASDPERKVADKPEIVATAAPIPVPAPEPKKPDPKPDTPPVPQPRAEAKPDDKAKPDPKPDPIAEAIKKDEAKKKAEKKAEQKKEAQKKAPPHPQPKFDANRIAALLDKREAQRHAATGAIVNQTATLGTLTGNAPHLTQSDIDALRAQIQACWNPPAGATDGADLIVKIRIMLNQDGSLSAEPILLNRGASPFFQVAAESAMRAVRRCQPYHLPIAKYEVWKDVEVTFDPRDMYRG